MRGRGKGVEGVAAARGAPCTSARNSGTRPIMLQDNIPKWCVDFLVLCWVAARAGGRGGVGRRVRAEELARRRGRAAHLGEHEAEDERQRDYDTGDHKEDENHEHVKIEPALQSLLCRTIGLRRAGRGPCRRVVENNTSNNDRSMT